MSNTTRTREDVVNLALQLLGTRTIRSLDEGSVESVQANLIYPRALEELLRSAPWSFATKRASLVRAEAVPSFAWTYLYLLPSDYILTLDFNDIDPETQNPPEYEIETEGIVTNQETANLRYIFYCETVALYPADVCSALAYLLAAKLAFPLTGNPDFGLSLLQIYDKQERPKAVRNNANEQRRRRHFRQPESDLISARYGSR